MELVRRFCSITLVSLVCLLTSCKKDTSGHLETESTSTGRVIQVDSGDPEMEKAMQAARDSFDKTWEALKQDEASANPSMAEVMIKVYFAEDDEPDGGEHLWASDVEYDGEVISATVQSEPLSDWMVIRNRKIEGAYTVQLLRKRMTNEERAEHDSHYPFQFPPVD